jgi:hypothetical protein
MINNSGLKIVVAAVAVLSVFSVLADTNAVESAAVAAPTRPGIETRVFKLNHVSASEVAQKFNTMWNGEFGHVWKVTRMAVDFPESNSVMVTAPGPILDACE